MAASKEITIDQIRIMIEHVEKKLDSNSVILTKIADEVGEIGGKVALHEHRITQLEEKEKAKKTDAKWVIMALVALGSLAIHFTRLIITQ